jgi:hypothetical protein
MHPGFECPIEDRRYLLAKRVVYRDSNDGTFWERESNCRGRIEWIRVILLKGESKWISVR